MMRTKLTVMTLVLMTGVSFGQGWGSLKGRVVWKGEPPMLPNLDVTKDQDHCLSKGPLPTETVIVDAKTKGVSSVFAFLKGKPSAIHPDYPQTAADVKKADIEAWKKLAGIAPDELSAAITAGKVKVADLKAPTVVDQMVCRYAPHAVGVRQGQITLVKNPEPITHNVKVSSFSGANDANPNMPPNTALTMEWSADTQPLSIQCSIHGWMTMSAMVFDHPYFAVTGTDGSFEIKNLPAGEFTFQLRNPKYIDPEKGGKGTAKGATLTIEPGKTKDLGEIAIDASFLN